MVVIGWTQFGWETSESQREINRDHVTCMAKFLLSPQHIRKRAINPCRRGLWPLTCYYHGPMLSPQASEFL